MTTTVELTQDNFDAVLAEHDLVVVDFWASWCGPCRAFAPVFEEAAARHPDVVFGKVDTDAQTQLAQEFAIRSIPTIAVVRDEVVLFQQPGVLSGNAIDDLVAQARALDMDEVRARFAAEVAEQERAARGA